MFRQESSVGENPYGYEYQIGGSLPLEAPSYVMRQADDELYHALQKGDCCYVLNSRQMGKSSLRVRTMYRLQAVGIRSGVIDMTTIGSQQITPEQWYVSILKGLVSGFQLNINLSAWWRDRTYLSLVKRFSDFLEEVLLTEIDQPIVIFVDEIDSVLGLNFPVDDFFALLRACYNKRVEQPVYHRLSFTLLGVASPSDLIADKSRTPFNIGYAIELQGFQLSEALPLLPGLQSVVKHPKAVLRYILEWTGGQPFLTQKLCQLVLNACQGGTQTGVTLSPGQEDLWVENLVRSHIVQNWQLQDKPEHLRTIASRLLWDEQRAGRSLGLYQQILTSLSPVPIDESREQIELLLSGLVVKEQESLRVRNRIYAEVFNPEWVDKQLAKLRPYAANLRAWLNSDRSDESRLLQGQALKDAKTWTQGKSLSDLDYQFLAASQELEQREQQKALEVERVHALAARLAQEQKTASLQRYLLSAVSLALVVISGLGLVTFWQYRKAKISEIQALASASEGRFDSNKRLDALIQAIKAKRQLQKIGSADAETKSQVEAVLQRAIYGVSESNRLSGHHGAVSGVAFSPDGKLIASTSLDNTVKLWSTEGALLSTLDGYKAAFYEVAFSPDGQLLAAANEDKTVKLWTRDGTLLRSLSGHTAAVWSVAFSPDGKTIASTSLDKTVKLWTIDGTLLRTLSGHTAAVYEAAFSPDGAMITTVSVDNTIKLWQRDGTLLKTLNGHSSVVYSVAFSPDGKTIASASEDRTIKLWKRDGTLLMTLNGHSAGVYGVSFSSDGKTITSASLDNTVKLWTSDGMLLQTFSGHTAPVLDVAFSPDGKTVASASLDNTVKLWVIDNKLLRTLTGHTATVWSTTFSPGSERIASASGGVIKVWQQNGTLLRTLSRSRVGFHDVAFSPDGETIAAADTVDNTIVLWKQDGTLLRTLRGHTSAVWSVAYAPSASRLLRNADANANSPDSEILASASGDNTIKLWKQDGTLLRTLRGHEATVYRVAFSADGKWIASAGLDNTVKLWSPNGTLLRTLRGQDAAVYDVGFSPDGQRLVTANEDSTIKLWTIDGMLLQTLKGHSGPVWSVAFSPDGDWIASASADGTVKLWKEDGTLIKTLNRHASGVHDVAFSPNGQLLASSSADNTVVLWNLQALLNLDELTHACNWVRDYLRTNAEVDAGDRHLCDGFSVR